MVINHSKYRTVNRVNRINDFFCKKKVSDGDKKLGNLCWKRQMTNYWFRMTVFQLVTQQSRKYLPHNICTDSYDHFSSQFSDVLSHNKRQFYNRHISERPKHHIQHKRETLILHNEQ